MRYVRKTLFLFILTGMAGIGHAQVDRVELQRNQAPVTFYNNEGPQARVDTREQIRQIGADLGKLVSTSRGRVGTGDRYFVIHSVTAPEGDKLDADIFGLGSNVGVDHIRNLRIIIQGYLQEAYGYSTADAALLAEYITIYNAVYRGDWAYFSGRFKKAVIDNLNPKSAGLSVRYQEWPGGTLMLIPLRSGGLSSVDTSTISDSRVVERLQAEDDRGITQRQGLIDLKEREAAQAALEAANRKEAARNEESAVAKDRQSLEERQRQLAEDRKKFEADKASGLISGARAAQREMELAQREAEAAVKTNELDRRESGITAQRQEAAKQEQFAQQKQDEARQDRGSIAAGTAEVRNNTSPSTGSGAVVSGGDKPAVTDKPVTGSTAPALSSSVPVNPGNRPDQTGGTASGNKTEQISVPTVIIEQGSSVSSLSPPSGSSASSAASSSISESPPFVSSAASSSLTSSSTTESPPSESSGSPASKSSDSKPLNLPLFLGTYIQGWHKNTVSMGLVVQMNKEFDINRIVSISALGEASGGIGSHYILEGSLAGMGEAYFLNKSLGLGLGGGFSFFSNNEEDPATVLENAFLRLALIFKKGYKTSVYAQRYFTGDWGLGVQFGWQF